MGYERRRKQFLRLRSFHCARCVPGGAAKSAVGARVCRIAAVFLVLAAGGAHEINHGIAPVSRPARDRQRGNLWPRGRRSRRSAGSKTEPVTRRSREDSLGKIACGALPAMGPQAGWWSLNPTNLTTHAGSCRAEKTALTHPKCNRCWRSVCYPCSRSYRVVLIKLLVRSREQAKVLFQPADAGK